MVEKKDSPHYMYTQSYLFNYQKKAVFAQVSARLLENLPEL